MRGSALLACVWLDKAWFAAGKADPWSLVHDSRSNYIRWILDAESMRSTAVPLSGLAAFVFPVRFFKIWDIDAPNQDGAAMLHSFGRIDSVAPYDIPARMIVM